MRSTWEFGITDVGGNLILRLCPAESLVCTTGRSSRAVFEREPEDVGCSVTINASQRANKDVLADRT